jgi:hypothetical protein
VLLADAPRARTEDFERGRAHFAPLRATAAKSGARFSSEA